MYLTYAPERVTAPIAVVDISDITAIEDRANEGQFITAMSVSIQLWSTDTQEALALVDKLHDTLRQADLVDMRENVFTISEDYTPSSPGLPPGLMRIICSYRIRMQ